MTDSVAMRSPGAGTQSLVAVGTGYLTLDIVVNGTTTLPLQLLTGGSCGNVMAILAFLGWKAFPIAHLADDSAAKIIFADLKRWQVETKYICQNENGRTPLIVERLKRHNAVTVSHRFELSCPICGSRFPRFKSVPVGRLPELATSLPKAHLFYFDRVNNSALSLASQFKKNGALIFFEPSRLGSGRLFSECLRMAHIVKYAEGKVGSIANFTKCYHPPVEIQTLGSKGLRFRTALGGSDVSDWIVLKAYPIKGVKDTAGAGDWCSSGLINSLLRSLGGGAIKINREKIEDALTEGQAIAALSCKFEGPRGMMYEISERQLVVALAGIKDKQDFKFKESVNVRKLQQLRIEKICQSCMRRNTPH